MASSVTSQDFKALAELEKSLVEKFLKGIVLYTGSRIIPFGKKLFAVPISALWEFF